MTHILPTDSEQTWEHHIFRTCMTVGNFLSKKAKCIKEKIIQIAAWIFNSPIYGWVWNGITHTIPQQVKKRVFGVQESEQAPPIKYEIKPTLSSRVDLLPKGLTNTRDLEKELPPTIMVDPETSTDKQVKEPSDTYSFHISSLAKIILAGTGALAAAAVGWYAKNSIFHPFLSRGSTPGTSIEPSSGLNGISRTFRKRTIDFPSDPL